MVIGFQLVNNLSNFKYRFILFTNIIYYMYVFQRPQTKKNPLCYCNALCNVCRCVSLNLNEFDKAYHQIQRTILQMQSKQQGLQKRQRQKKKQNNSKKYAQRQPVSQEKRRPQRCKTYSCLYSCNDELIKQNAFLNQYFDTFEERYHANRGELQELKNENMYLRDVMNTEMRKNKQKKYEANLEEQNQTSKNSFTKREVEIMKDRLLNNALLTRDANEFKQTSETFLPAFSKNYKKFPNRSAISRFQQNDRCTPSQQFTPSSNRHVQRNLRA